MKILKKIFKFFFILLIFVFVLYLFNKKYLNTTITPSLTDEVNTDIKNNTNNFTNILNDALNNYGVKAAIAINLDSDKILYEKSKDALITPYSLAKLFTIDYALSILDTTEVVDVDAEILSLTPPNSTVAYITPGLHTVRNLIEGMLLPSGNDASNALALHIANKFVDSTLSTEEKLNVFKTKLNKYLKEVGYSNSNILDANGYDDNSKTTVKDLYKVTKNLLKHSFIKETVGKYICVSNTPDGNSYTWQNTNKFLNENSNFYDKNVHGVKTGSGNNLHNIITLYEKNGIHYIFIVTHANSDFNRYESVKEMISTILKNY